jgi:hypothetical protein
MPRDGVCPQHGDGIPQTHRAERRNVKTTVAAVHAARGLRLVNTAPRKRTDILQCTHNAELVSTGTLIRV